MGYEITYRIRPDDAEFEWVDRVSATLDVLAARTDELVMAWGGSWS